MVVGSFVMAHQNTVQLIAHSLEHLYEEARDAGAADVLERIVAATEVLRGLRGAAESLSSQS